MAGRSFRRSVRWAVALVSAASALVLVACEPTPPTGTTTTTVPSGWTQSTLLSGLNNPQGVARDAAGNLYVAEYGANRVKKLTPTGTVTTLPFTGLDGPSGVAVDSEGSVYVASVNNQQIKKLTSGGAQSVIFQGGSLAQVTRDIAVSPSGVITITLPGMNIVGTLNPATKAVTAIPVTTGFTKTWGVGLTSTGEVIATDLGALSPPAPQEIFGKVVRRPSGGPNQTVALAGLRHPKRVAADSAGNIYVTDDVVYKVTAGGIQTTLPFTGVSNPDGIVVDPSGSVYVVSSGSSGALIRLTKA